MGLENKKTNHISPIHLLKFGGLGAISAWALIHAPKLIDKEDKNAFSLGRALKAPSTPENIAPLNDDLESIVAPQTPDVWKLSVSERIELMSKPEFFTELQSKNTREIITSQFDETEYTEKIDKNIPKKNTCGEAALATSIKMLEFLNTGIVPDVTISDVYAGLKGLSFTDNHNYTTPLGYYDSEGYMYHFGLSGALKSLAPSQILNAEYLFPEFDLGARYWMIVPESLWPKAFLKAQDICESGGFTIICCVKWGIGHIILATDVKKDGTAIIVDSYSAEARRVKLKYYFDLYKDPDFPEKGKQVGLINILGVTPTFPK